MATKLETTPDGIICSCCGQDKPAYHFYSQRGKTTNVTRFFFASDAWLSSQCWACNGSYRCLGCGELKAASEFRVGGRFCDACKSIGICTVTPAIYVRHAKQEAEAVVSVETAENMGFEIEVDE